MSAAMAELFPTNIRYGSMTIAYNVSVALLGGITPYFATWLIASTGDRFAPVLREQAAVAGARERQRRGRRAAR
jgi:MHS family proline/betaine transporter-like MFS transporter